MIISLENAQYIDNYRLYLTFNTGEMGTVDLEDLIFKCAAAEPLRNSDKFKAFFLDSWSTVAWDCGFDVSPETLYERATGKRVSWLYEKSD